MFGLLKDGVSASLPQDLFVPKVRGRFRRQILIKIKNASDFEKIKNCLENLPSGWIIDIDPISVV